MATYDSILVRQNLQDQGTIPRTGGWYYCPDIIAAGTKPIDPNILTTPKSYATDPTQPVVLRATNFIYVRGKNLSKAPQKGTARVFAAPSSLVLYPYLWEDHAILTQNKSETSEIETLAPDATGITKDPFIWIPPDVSEHHCLVGFISTPDHPYEVQKPPSAVHSTDELAAWIAKTGGTGWHNVQFTTAGAPTFTSTTHYPASSRTSRLQFSITCESCPVGSQVTFSCGKPLPDGTYINLPVSTVTSPRSMGFFIECEVPAGWESYMNYSYYANGKPPVDENFSVSMSASVITQTNARAAGLGRPVYDVFPNHIGIQANGLMAREMPVYELIPVGSDTTKLATPL